MPKHKRVAVNGCYDVLHIGHVRLLNWAARMGLLWVGINSDSSIKKLKGESRPINNESIRSEFLMALHSVSCVSIFSEENSVEFLKRIVPDIYVCGGNYNLETMNQEEREYLQSINCEIKFFPLIEGYSSSRIIDKLNK